MKKILLVITLTVSISASALMLNLKNVEIKTLINTVAMATNKNFMIDPRVKGRVNVISNKEIDNEQLYQVFLSVLKAHGFVVIEGENLSRVVPQNLTKNESAYVSSKSTDAIITKVIKLQDIAAAQIVPIVRPLMSSYGLLSVHAPSNSLIVIDTGANIARLENIITSLDLPMDDDFEFIKLQNATAAQIAATIKPLFGAKNTLVSINVDKHNNQLIVGGSKEKRLKVRLLVSELDKYKIDAGTTAIIYLKYANATDILPILQGINQHNSAAVKDQKNIIKSNIQANEATNSIIVTGDNETKQVVKNIIAKLDVRRAQVLIEAVIAEVNTSDADELGIQWVAQGGAGIGITNLNGAIPGMIAAAGGNSESWANVNIAGGANFLTGSYDKGKNTGIGMVINALKSTGNTNILSTPSILTLDNNEAEIVVGQEVPFITNKQLSSSNSNPFQNYERKDVGLKLKVKPQINDGSSIKLDITQEISNVMNSSSAADLITSKRTLNTSVMVEDGKMLVLGGLIDDSWRDSVAKVPVLGDLPFFGKLFSYNTRTKGKSNLMIFIRPTIIKDQILSDEISLEKYDYIKAQQLLINQDSPIQDLDNFLSGGNKKQNNNVNSVQNSLSNDNKRVEKTAIQHTNDRANIAQDVVAANDDSFKAQQIVINDEDFSDHKTQVDNYTPVSNSSYYIK